MNSNNDELQLIISKSKEELNKIKRAEYLIKNKDKIALRRCDRRLGVIVGVPGVELCDVRFDFFSRPF